MGTDNSDEHEARTAELVTQLHSIVAELEAMHPGRKFPLDGHLVGSLAEVAAEAMFDLKLVRASTAGHDAVAADGRAVEIKGTYGTSGVGLRTTSHDAAVVLIVLRLSKQVGIPHEVVYNGPLALMSAVVGAVGSNGQARLGLGRLRDLNRTVAEEDRVAQRKTR